MGKTRACAVSTVAWFFSAKDECHKLPPELNKSVCGSQCGVGQGAEFARSGEKGHLSGKRPQKMEPSDRPNLCNHLFSIGSKLEAEHTWFWASDRSQRYSGWSSVQQGADNRWKRKCGKSSGAPAEHGHGEGQVSTVQRRKFHGCAGAGFSCLWSHPRNSPACGWIYSQPIFLCSL